MDLLRAAAGPPWQSRVVAVYATVEALHRDAELAPLAERAAVALTLTSDDVIAAMSDAASPQAVVAVASRPGPDALHLPTVGFGVLLVEVRDPGNVGTVIRAADAAGAAFVALSPASADPFAPKAVRASAGSLFHVPVSTDVSPEVVAERAHRAGWRVLATAADGAHSLDHVGPAESPIPLTEGHVWVLGNEAHGLTDAVTSIADGEVAIEIRGRAESLNLAMAATVLLFTSARHQARPG